MSDPSAPTPAAEPRSPLDDVFSDLYGELCVIARSRLRRHGQAVVTSTGALVHECWLRLQRSGRLRLDDEARFLALAAEVMRSAIVDAVRRARAERRGGGAEHVALESTAGELPHGDADDVLDVDAALKSLAELDAPAAQVVQMRYFAGLSDAQVATALGVSERTVRRHWSRARAFLALALKR